MMQGDESFNLARSLQKALSRRKTLYAHPPIVDENVAWFAVTKSGRRYSVRVMEIED